MIRDDDSLGYLMRQVMRKYHYCMQVKASELNIYPGQSPILFLLWKRDGRSQKEIAERLKVTPSTVTVMIKRMEKTGLVERRTDEKDLRVSRVYLTEQGKNIRAELEKILDAVEVQCFEGFTEEEKILLRRFLIHMRTNLSES